MHAEQNGRNTGNDAGAGVTQREEDTGGIEEAVIVLMRQVAADNSPFFCLCFVEITLSADICDRTIGYAHNHQNRFGRGKPLP